MSNLGGDRVSAQYPFQKQTFSRSSQKITQNMVSKFAVAVQFCLISALCSKYFVQDCRSIIQDLRNKIFE